MRRIVALMLVLGSAMLGGCATQQAAYDYTAFQQSKPASLLVLPPVNESPEINATASVWSHATRPLAEAGYYVLPVTMVDETLKQNGVQVAAEAHEIPYPKLRDVFGADAAVYLKVKNYGTTYKLIDSETRVTVEARLLDLRSGRLLWEGNATATSAEQSQQSQGGIIGLLVTALVKQIIGTATDESYTYAGIAQARMLSAPRFNGVLPGPRSPLYGQPPPSR